MGASSSSTRRRRTPAAAGRRSRSEPLAYAHVAFDLDGTLIDSRHDLAEAVNHVLRSFGLAEVPPRTLYSYVGLGARYLVEQALGPDGDDRLDEGVARFLEYYRHHLLDHTRPYPGIADALSTLAARGVTLSVLSNKPEGLSRVILDGLGLRAHFAAVIGGDTLPTRKPDPAGVAHLRALTGTPPERFLLVGDSSVDVRTARAGGVAFCGVAWGLVPEDLWAAGPERVVSSAREIVDVVDGAAG